jgi:Zn-dependent protease with chaperone function
LKVTHGDYFDGKSSRRQPAELHEEGGRLSIRIDRQVQVGATAIAEVEISSRLGNTPRYLTFPGGATFECNDNSAIDRLIQAHGPPGHSGLLHRLESHLRYILPALVLVIAFTWAGILWGIPALAKTAAYSLPPSASNLIGDGALELLDRQIFTPSELSAEKQAQVQAAFGPIIARYQEGFQIRALFRHGGKLGANAMALPSGTIIFTDELVNLAETQEELSAILAHEIGHVVRRHGLRQTLQTSALGILVVTITGDVSSLSSLVTALPVILTQLGYSREFEREADHFALTIMQEQGIPPQYFASALQRIERAARCTDTADSNAAQGQACEAAENGSESANDSLSSYLSTHPATQERIKAFLPPAI